MNWKDTSPHAHSVRPGWAPGQGCRQSCWPAHPPALARVSIDACRQPSDLRLWPSLSPTGTCLKLNTPQQSLTCHSTCPILVTYHPAVQDKTPESHSAPPFTQASRPVPPRSVPLECPLLSTPSPTPPRPPGPCSSLLTGSLLPLLPHSFKKR